MRLALSHEKFTERAQKGNSGDNENDNSPAPDPIGFLDSIVNFEINLGAALLVRVGSKEGLALGVLHILIIRFYYF